MLLHLKKKVCGDCHKQNFVIKAVCRCIMTNNHRSEVGNCFQVNACFISGLVQNERKIQEKNTQMTFK